MRATKLAKARMQACRKWPALSHAILSQTPLARRGIQTMAVDKHWRLYFDPAFIEEQSIDLLAGVILHETCHLLLRHHARAKGNGLTTPQQLNQWNYACDYAVNSMLKSASIKLPIGGLDATVSGLPENKAAEWYYRELTEQSKEKQSDDKDDEQPDEESDDDQEESPSEEETSGEDNQEQEAEWSPDQPGEEGQETGDEKGQEDSQGGSGESDEQGQDGDGQSDSPGDGGEAGDQDGSTQASQGTDSSGGEDATVYPSAQGQGGSCSDGKQRAWELGDPTDDNPGIDETDADALIRDTVERIQSKGDGAGSLSSFCKEILKPKVDPKRLILAAIRKATDNLVAGGDGRFSYRRPSRRPNGGGLIRPRTFTPVPKIKVLIDTSGSMNNVDYQLSVGLVAKCISSLRLRDGVEVVTGDTRAAWAGKVFDHSKINLVGGGGTEMDAIIASMCSQKDKPDLIIVCSDGETGWPSKSLGVPVVACITREYTMRHVPKWITSVCLEAV